MSSSRREISRQLPGRFVIVLRLEDADAVMKGNATNRRGNVTITDIRGTTELWDGEAGDKGLYLTKIHGGEKKVAERLVSSLKRGSVIIVPSNCFVWVVDGPSAAERT